MIQFQTNSGPVNAYLAVPEQGSGPGVIVLHAWWGLTDIFKQVCDRLAQAGFVALAPDLYHGKTATTVEEAEALASALNQESERASSEIAASVQFLLRHEATLRASGRGKLAFIGFSLGGAYSLDTSVNLPDEIAAVVIFYATYTGLDFSRARAAYLFNLAQDDPFETPESVAEMEQELRVAGRQATFYTYPGTKHWFFEDNRPEYDPEAAHLAWDRTIAFLHERLD